MHDFFEDHQSSDPLLEVEVDEEIGISVVFKSVSHCEWRKFDPS